MRIRIGRWEFDNVFYDREADVLYLHKGDPAAAAAFEESPEGHALRFDDMGDLVGVTILNAGRLLERDGALAVTVPRVLSVSAEDLAPALR